MANIQDVMGYVNPDPGFQGFVHNPNQAAPSPVPNVPAPEPGQFNPGVPMADPFGSGTNSPVLPVPGGPPIQFAPGGVPLEQAQQAAADFEQAANRNGFGPAIPAPGTAPPPHGLAPHAPGHAPARAAQPGQVNQDMTDLEKGFQSAADTERAALEKSELDRLMNATRESDVLGQQGQLREAQAQELRDKQEQVRQVSAQLDEEDKRNLEVAKNKTIPDFWEGKTGRLVGSAIAVALAGAGSALLGQTRNVASEVIQHNIDQYMSQQKERVDNLFKYAEARGRVNDQTRKRYAMELLDLKDQHTYLLEAARDRVAQVAAESKGSADANQIALLKAGLDKQIIQDRMGVRKLRGELLLQTSEVAKNKAQSTLAYAQANEANAKAKSFGEGYGLGGMKGQQLVLGASKFLEGVINKDPEAKNALESEVKYANALEALKSGSGMGDKLVVDEITKAATNLGARPQSVKVFEAATGGKFDQLMGGLQQAMTGKALTPKQSANVQKFLEYTLQAKREQKAKVRERIKTGVSQNPIFQGNPGLIDAALDTHFGQAGPVAPSQAQPQDQRAEAEQWARSHPNDPRSKAVLAKLGLH